jgi:RimJ/RimL family protein N-acetyltransferase
MLWISGMRALRIVSARIGLRAGDDDGTLVGVPLTVPDLGDDLVRLRPPDPRDIDAITDACQDPEIPRFTRIPSPYLRSHAEGWVAMAADAWRAGTGAAFVVVDPHDDTLLLGSTGIMHLGDDPRCPEIGYWVAKPRRGRGVATRALRLAARWAVLALGVARLELMAHVDNAASQRVAARAGFTREGVLRAYTIIGGHLSDVVMFSLLPADLAAQPRSPEPRP